MGRARSMLGMRGTRLWWRFGNGVFFGHFGTLRWIELVVLMSDDYDA